MVSLLFRAPGWDPEEVRLFYRPLRAMTLLWEPVAGLGRVHSSGPGPRLRDPPASPTAVWLHSGEERQPVGVPPWSPGRKGQDGHCCRGLRWQRLGQYSAPEVRGWAKAGVALVRSRYADGARRDSLLAGAFHARGASWEPKKRQ